MSEPYRIFVFCDDESHPKRAAVTNFVRVTPGPLSPSGGWHERPSSRALAAPGAGRHLIGDAPAEAGWANDPDVSNADVRDRYELTCRRCRHPRPVVARRETLYTALDGWETLGVSEVSLSQLAASIR